jgi:hypothetical protein
MKSGSQSSLTYKYCKPLRLLKKGDMLPLRPLEDRFLKHNVQHQLR